MECLLSVGDIEPAYICAAAVVLRVYILRFVLRKRHLVAAYEGTALAVWVVLPGPATIIIDIGKVGRYAHTHAKLWNQRNIGGSRTVVGLNLYSAFFKEFVSQSVVSSYREAAFNDDADRILVLARLDGADGTLGCNIAPCTQTLGKAGGTLVVVLGFPEVGFQRTPKHLNAIYSPTAQGTRLVNRDGVVTSTDDDAVGGFLQLRSYPVINPHVFKSLSYLELL